MFKQQLSGKKIFILLASIGLCEGIGLLGTPFTIASVSTWYITLQKPFFSPPNWIFGPVWTVLYALMGISLYLVFDSKKTNRRSALTFFFIQLTLNFTWSLVFFGLRAPLFAFINIVFLWIAIIITMTKFRAISRPSFYLLIPYILWVSFAAILNLSIVLLNP